MNSLCERQVTPSKGHRAKAQTDNTFTPTCNLEFPFYQNCTHTVKNSVIIKHAMRLCMSQTNFSYSPASYASTETFFAAVCGSFSSSDMNIGSQHSVKVIAPHALLFIVTLRIVYIKELMGLHKDSGKPTLHLRAIGKPFSTQRLFIISCVPFSLQSARKEYFPHKERILGRRTHKEMRKKTKGDFLFFCQRY